MADNYLEQRMDDLRSGRIRRENQASSKSMKRTGLNFRFSSRRILILGMNYDLFSEIGKAFVKKDCKVAILDNDCSMGETLAQGEGFRYIKGDPHDKSDIAYAFENVIKAWRDIDVVVTGPQNFSFSIEILTTIHQRFPILSEYGKRIFMISKEEIQNYDFYLKNQKETGIFLNFIILSDTSINLPALISTILFFSSNASVGIEGSIIRLK